MMFTKEEIDAERGVVSESEYLLYDEEGDGFVDLPSLIEHCQTLLDAGYEKIVFEEYYGEWQVEKIVPETDEDVIRRLEKKNKDRAKKYKKYLALKKEFEGE